MMPRLRHISTIPARTTLFLPMQCRHRSSKATESKSGFSFSQYFASQGKAGKSNASKRPSASLLLQMMNLIHPIETKKKKAPINDNTSYSWAIIATVAIFAIGTGTALYSANKKKLIIDKSVLRNKDLDPSKLKVIDAMRISSTGKKVLPGHTQAHKVAFVNDKGETEYYYYKEPNNRDSLIKELIVGSIARALLGKKVPDIYAVETPLNDKENHSHFAVMSEGLGGNVKRDNLETWAESYSEDEEEIKFGPKHLGEAIAFDMLMGKTDCKLANLVLIKNNEGECYTIDQESALRKKSKFLKKASSGVEFLCEFAKDTFDDRFKNGLAPDNVEVKTDPNQPVKDKTSIKAKIYPILETAINADIESGKVLELYKKFASLTDQDFENIFNQFGTLIHQDERKLILADLKQRQERTREYLASQENILQTALKKVLR